MDFNSFSTNSLSSSQSSSIFPPPPPSSFSSSSDTTTVLQKEHMFDKVVTPSDVGKLNRLVIPKQHAQKYFPLERTTTTGIWNTVVDNDSSLTTEKGLLLNFEEDRTAGKIWRFRYSYWSSSQSYVITKGWSRFVKDKKLNSGDVISFHRAKDRLFIDWRYQIHHHQQQQQYQQQHHFYFNQQRYWNAPGPGPLFSPNLYYFNQPLNITSMDQYSLLDSRPVIVGSYCGGGGGGGRAYEWADQGMNMRSTVQQQQYPQLLMNTTHVDNDDEAETEAAVSPSSSASIHKDGKMKQLRLFGVNMKCPSSPQPNS